MSKEENETPIEALYYFNSEFISLIEIKVGEDYHWLRIPKDTKEVEKLAFVSKGTEIVKENEINLRVFENAELRFDDHFGKFIYNEVSDLVESKPVNEIPEDLIELIMNWLTNR